MCVLCDLKVLCKDVADSVILARIGAFLPFVCIVSVQVAKDVAKSRRFPSALL